MHPTPFKNIVPVPFNWCDYYLRLILYLYDCIYYCLLHTIYIESYENYIIPKFIFIWLIFFESWLIIFTLLLWSMGANYYYFFSVNYLKFESLTLHFTCFKWFNLINLKATKVDYFQAKWILLVSVLINSGYIYPHLVSLVK